MMSRADYVLIAKVINELYNTDDYIDHQTIEAVVDSLADELENDNARFDRDRFIAACLKDNNNG